VKAVPRRSNDFQKVVYFVRRHIAPDAEVRESVMLTDRVTGEPREVDVLVEGHLGGEKVTIAIEVRDHARKPGVEWVDAVHGKYRDLPVDKVVLVSRSGFTTSALRKAQSLGIEALTPYQEISRYGPLAKIAVEAEARTVTGVRLHDALAYLTDQELPVRVKESTALYDPHGVESSNVSELAQYAMSTPDATEVYRTAEPGHGALDIVFTELTLHNNATGETFAPRVKFETDGSLHPINSVRFQWEIEVTREPVELQHGAMRGTPFAYGKADVAGVETLVVIAGERLDEPLSEIE
jgi:hypothetical protein